jgi:hypothetical protein
MRSPVQGCAVLLLFLVSLSTFGAEPAHDAALLARVVAAQQGHTTVQGELRWLTRRVDQPDEPAREQRVRFYLAFPNRYAVVVTKPDDAESKQSFISDGITRWEVTQLFDGEKPDVKAAPVGGDDEIERRLLACFRFDLAALQRDFTIAASATADDGASIVLTPIAAKLAEQLVVLVLTFDAANKLTNIRSDDPQGNRLDFTVLKAVYDEKFDDGLFHVGP